MGHRPITGPVVRHDVDGPLDLLEGADGAPYPEAVQILARSLHNSDQTSGTIGAMLDELVAAVESVAAAATDHLPEAARSEPAAPRPGLQVYAYPASVRAFAEDLDGHFAEDGPAWVERYLLTLADVEDIGRQGAPPMTGLGPGPLVDDRVTIRNFPSGGDHLADMHDDPDQGTVGGPWATAVAGPWWLRWLRR